MIGTSPDEDKGHLRGQKVCVLRRNGLYWLGGSSWHEDITLAKMFPADQMEAKARIDIGMPCEMVYVAPRAIERMSAVLIGEPKPPSKHRR